MTDYVSALREQLVDAAAREARSRRRPSWPRLTLAPRRLALAGVLAAALVLAVAVELRSEPQPAPVTQRPPVPAPAPGARPLFGGTLEGGVRYATRVMVPPVSFVVPDDLWEVRTADDPDGVVLGRRRGTSTPGGERPAAEFVSVERLRQVVDPRMGVVIDAPADLVGWLREHPDLVIGPPRDTRLAGSPATRVDVRVSFEEPAQPDPWCEQFRRSCTLVTPDRSATDGTRSRWWLLEVDGEPVTVIVSGTGERAFRRALEHTAPILASLRIGR